MSHLARFRILVVFSLLAGAANAQVFSNTDPITTVSPEPPARINDRQTTISYGALDLKSLREIETEREAQGLIRNFAIPSDVDLSPADVGEITYHDDGFVSWSLRIQSKNAKNINLGFVWDNVPESTFVLLLDGNGEPADEPMLADLNNPNGEIYTAIVEGSAMEVYAEVDADDWQAFLNSFRIKRISLGFLDFGEALDFGGNTLRSNACHTDVVCPEGDPWPSQISSVGAYTLNGFGTCSGSLVNNTAEDGIPYFLSANHCGLQNSPGTIVVYWNYQNSYCRTPGSAASGAPGDGPLNMHTNGAQARMTYQPSDTTLVRLNSVPNPAWNVDYAGWDNRGLTARPPNGFGVHHPNVEEKRIAFENNTFNNTTISIGGPGISVWSINYDVGGLEGGSSGSPLYNNIGRIVGTATAVNTFSVICGSGQAQYYGRFDLGWTGGGSSSTRLSDWLDPLGTGQGTLNPLNFTPPELSDFDIVAPTDGDPLVPATATIDWTDSTNAEEYRLLVDDDPNFASPAIDQTIAAPTSEYTPAQGELLDDVTYYLKVDAMNYLETRASLQGTISFTTIIDCNGNLINDPDELATNDCNGNLQPDDCDVVPAFVGAQSGQLSPIGFGANKSFIMNFVREATGDVTLDFTASGDFDATSEKVSVFINGVLEGQVLEIGTNCPSTIVDTDQLIVPMSNWNAAVASGAGTVTINMTPTSQVSASECLSGSYIQVAVSYDGAAYSADANMDQIPDECSVACGPADVTTTGAGVGDPGYGVPDGAVTAADLNYFVNAWVASDTSIADVTTTGAGAGDPGYGVPDGSVTAADLNYFVNFWVAGCP